MTVERFIKDCLAYGTEWRLIGARTGRRLASKTNSSHTRKQMYMNCEFSSAYPSIEMRGNNEYAVPVVCIWVSDM